MATPMMGVMMIIAIAGASFGSSRIQSVFVLINLFSEKHMLMMTDGDHDNDYDDDGWHDCRYCRRNTNKLC